MVSFKFIHTADLHLDSQFKGISGLSDGIRSFLRESTFTSLDRLVELAVSEQVDFMVISGDVYDAQDSSLQAQLRFYEALDRLGKHGIGVYVIHGNHDPLDSPRMKTGKREHVHVFGPEFEQVTAYRRQDQRAAAVIGGISYPTAKVIENTSLRFQRDKDNSLFHIALLHANIDGDPAHETYSPCTQQDLIASGYDYWALGHIHKRQILHELPHIVYPGNIQGRSIRETGVKGCYVVQVAEDGGVNMRFHDLDTVRWFHETIPIDSIAGEEAFQTQVEERMQEISRECPGKMSIVRFVLTGRGSLHEKLEEGRIAVELLHELHRRAIRSASEPSGLAGLVWVESFDVRSGPWIDREALLKEDSFLGELLRYGQQAREDMTTRAEVLRSALNPLMANRELRMLLNETDDEECAGWLRRAEEMAVLLLAGEGGGESTDED
ncbi:DNA repair exonuclease [Paenibacillus dokdonensis]|uniref:DNA repair exonuclease n=1 Tax=Paenibacillus dokdonensis TaxID=2567944 RepID=A0ABU6GI29_9BACL|nr:DNA repair exonuclease [Paenibacillus dokdonensis]MEC0239083.1 DNA repair exonuclease [Paenibacillus dokdonensis]